jgi:predicted esterase
MYFLRQGHDVYVSDAVERGRASWARYPEIFKTEPFFRAKKEAWELFRIGPPDSYKTEPAQRVAFAGEKFPTQAFDQFMKQGVPRWATNDAATQKAYDEYVQKICPCTIIVHSQGGNFAFNMALNAPEKIKAIVGVEASGAPDPAKVDAAKVKGVPHLFVWGDNFAPGTLWDRLKPTVQKWHEAVRTAGADADWVELPKRGITGNSHMLMMDTNSDEIAGFIQTWLTEKGLMK